ncbi:fibrinogen C domain-containing protein 1 isoform X2 [Procambarus clarkii]|uniref:fibrinogen C domain-containing protein 1 isoform X2 n=1 Tax=Procambarus clarkii TaxID=6728 RepID=UPI001E675E9F|nr:fibrinogen C domain-containing protein 1-like isoform X2 [Procambarus clarkii]
MLTTAASMAAMLTTAASMAAMLTTVASMAAFATNTTAVPGGGAGSLGPSAEAAESLCKVCPDLPACKDNNTTLMQEKQRHRGNMVDVDQLDPTSDPVLSLVLTQCVSLHSHNQELMERVERLEAEKASLLLQMIQLRVGLVELGAADQYTRHTRDTSNRLDFPLEAPSSGLAPAGRSPPRNPNLFAARFRPVDCADYLQLGHTTSGVYKIYPFRPVEVWCDMETDGGGWTVFLARNNLTKHENFNRTWSDYREGFGNASGEYWLGNENLHTMTYNRAYTLRMDFRLTDGTDKWGEWPEFVVDDEAALYRLTASKYNALSTIDHCLAVHTGKSFSTFDYDNDHTPAKNCAEESKGGWWYYNCGTLDPTIAFTAPGQLNTTCTYKMNNKKVPLHGPSLQMKLRPAACDKTVKAVHLNGYSCHDHNV